MRTAQQSLLCRPRLIPQSRRSRVLKLSPCSAKQNAKLLAFLSKEFPASELNGFSSLVNFGPSSGEPIHRWFHYREGFSTRLVESFAGDLAQGSSLLDPFCGCGTTLIAGQRLGHKCVGFDVNPLAVLVTNTKTSRYSERDIDALERYRSRLSRLRRGDPKAPTPTLRIIKRVFHPRVLDTLLCAKNLIDHVENAKHRGFLLTAWLSILEDVSNVYKEGNGIKYKNRIRTPRGYFSVPLEEWQAEAFPQDKWTLVMSKLGQQLEMMISDAKARRNVGGVAHAYCESAQTMPQVAPETIALSIFSPPYCNCFNYFKAFKIELWMGGFVRSYEEMRQLNARAIRSHVETVLRRREDGPMEFVEEFARLLDPETLWDRRIPDAIRGYFIDMRLVFERLNTLLKPGGTCVIVVGNSAYGGILIPTDALLAKVGESVGLRFKKLGVARHLTTSSQQKLALEDRRSFLRESALVLKKPLA